MPCHLHQVADAVLYCRHRTAFITLVVQQYNPALVNTLVECLDSHPHINALGLRAGLVGRICTFPCSISMSLLCSLHPACCSMTQVGNVLVVLSAVTLSLC